MGGAKRYPSVLNQGDGFRKRLNPSYALELKRAIEQKTPIILSKRGSESNEDFCFRNLRRNNIWRHGSLSQRT